MSDKIIQHLNTFPSPPTTNESPHDARVRLWKTITMDNISSVDLLCRIAFPDCFVDEIKERYSILEIAYYALIRKLFE